ncbi:MAG: Zn-dependent hydrolase [Candidatus Limnocylindria bacterium]
MRADAARLRERIARLSAIGGRGPSVTRLGLTSEEQAARELVASWLAARGGAVRRDAAANLFARFGPAEGNVVMTGSHLDSVPNGGRYDGALGVLCAVEAVETLLDAGAPIRGPLEVVGWADEEGARFGIGLFGSAAAFGRLPPKAAERRDAGGISIAEALRALGEAGDPTAARRADVAAYVELHIEQGPHLAGADRALGVVGDIVGIVHGRVTVTGRADHAGTTPMGARHDALAGAAEMIGALEDAALHRAGSVATVGEIAVRPGAKNVVPAECAFSVDVRAPDMRSLGAVTRQFRQAMRLICDARGLRSSLDVFSQVPPTRMDPDLAGLLRRSAAAVGVEAPTLLSGAGHDTMNAVLAGVPSAMLFVRSHGGSHTPREHASVEDAALGASALAIALADLVA